MYRPKHRAPSRRRPTRTHASFAAVGAVALALVAVLGPASYADGSWSSSDAGKPGQPASRPSRATDAKDDKGDKDKAAGQLARDQRRLRAAGRRGALAQAADADAGPRDAVRDAVPVRRGVDRQHPLRPLAERAVGRLQLRRRRPGPPGPRGRDRHRRDRGDGQEQAQLRPVRRARPRQRREHPLRAHGLGAGHRRPAADPGPAARHGRQHRQLARLAPALRGAGRRRRGRRVVPRRRVPDGQRPAVAELRGRRRRRRRSAPRSPPTSRSPATCTAARAPR